MPRKFDPQPIVDHLASLLVNNEVLTNALIDDYDDPRLVLVRNNQAAAHALANKLLDGMGMTTDCCAEPPGGK